MVATPDACLAPVYAMFTRTIVEDRTIAPWHLEFLIGYCGRRLPSIAKSRVCPCRGATHIDAVLAV